MPPPSAAPSSFTVQVRRPGEDEMWDQLGDEWSRLDGLIEPPGRLYVRTEDDSNGRKFVVGVHLDGLPVSSDLLRNLPITRVENLLNIEPMSQDQFLAELQPLERKRGDDPAAFSKKVAWYYRYFSTLSSRPVKMIADHANVPLPTAHGWVREARLRGELPPGKQGKATAGS